MFTVEESTLLARMLRAILWIVVCVVVASSCFLLVRSLLHATPHG
jgi:hypothetical protein